MILNGLIKNDDLYFNKDKRWALFSDEEIDKLIIASKEGGGLEFKDRLEFIRWAENARMCSLLIQGLLSGRLAVDLTNGGGVPDFFETELEDDVK